MKDIIKRRHKIECEKFYSREIIISQDFENDIIDHNTRKLTYQEKCEIFNPDWYYLPTNKPFEFTGFIIKKINNYQFFILEVICENELFYYPFTMFRGNIFKGKINNAKYLKGSNQLFDGCEYIKTEILNEPRWAGLYDTDLSSFICFCLDVFYKKWKAREVKGYIPNSELIKSIPISEREKTDWHSKNFVSNVTMYKIEEIE